MTWLLKALNRGGLAGIIICIVSAMHAFQACMVFRYPSSIGATPLLEIGAVFRLIGLPDSTPFVAACLLASAIIGLSGTIFRVGWERISLFFLQHFFLGVMAWGGLRAAMSAHYLDGTPMNAPHILNDQIGMSALFLVHTFAILYRCWAAE